MNWYRIVSSSLNFVLPGRVLANRTLPPGGKEFRNFFDKPQSRSLEDKVKFIVWLHEMLQSKKLNVWDELRDAGFSKELRHEFLRANLTPEQIVTMTEVFVFPDQAERNEIRIHAKKVLDARNEKISVNPDI